MKHIFIPTEQGTHLKDGVRGFIKSFPDNVRVRPESRVLVSLDDIELAPVVEKPKPPAPVPSEIANWRAKAVLAQMGLLAQVEVALTSLQEPQRTVVGFAWNGDAKLSRNSPTVLALGAALQLDAAALDEFFRAAAAIEI